MARVLHEGGRTTVAKLGAACKKPKSVKMGLRAYLEAQRQWKVVEVSHGTQEVTPLTSASEGRKGKLDTKCKPQTRMDTEAAGEMPTQVSCVKQKLLVKIAKRTTNRRA